MFRAAELVGYGLVFASFVTMLLANLFLASSELHSEHLVTTNFTFIVVALLIWTHALARHNYLLTNDVPIFTVLYIACTCLVGVSSIYYHSDWQRFMFLDVMSIKLYLSYVLFLEWALATSINLPEACFAAVVAYGIAFTLEVALDSSASSAVRNSANVAVVSVLGVVDVGFALKHFLMHQKLERAMGWFVVSIALFLGACVAKYFDETLADREAAAWCHSVWHILCGFGIGIHYVYFLARTDVYVAPADSTRHSSNSYQKVGLH